MLVHATPSFCCADLPACVSSSLEMGVVVASHECSGDRSEIESGVIRDFDDRLSV